MTENIHSGPSCPSNLEQIHQWVRRVGNLEDETVSLSLAFASSLMPAMHASGSRQVSAVQAASGRKLCLPSDRPNGTSSVSDTPGLEKS